MRAIVLGLLTLLAWPTAGRAETTPPAASLSVRVNVPGASLELDGKKLDGQKAASAALEVSPGTHKLKIAHPRYTRWEGELRVGQGERAHVDVELKPGRFPLVCFVGMASISAALLGTGAGVLGSAYSEPGGPSLTRTAVGASFLGLGGAAVITTGVLGAFVRWRKAGARIEIAPSGSGAQVMASGTLP